MNFLTHKIARIKLFFSDLKPILLSHHPKCNTFSDHVYHIGNHWLCLGCFTYYPTIMITIIFSIIFFEFSQINIAIMFFVSFIFVVPIVLNIFNLTKSRMLKILTKISLGIGTGLFIISILNMSFLHIILKILCLLQVNFFAGLIGYVRANGIIEECKACEYKKDWKNCPGMRNVMENLYEHGFKKEKDISIKN